MLLLTLVSSVASAQGEGPPVPDGVCYPVDGTGYIVTFGDALSPDGLKIPVGTLSPLLQGDSLVVESGTITFLDFRNGQSSVFGQGTRLVIPAVVDPDRPNWWHRLEAQVAGSLSNPERRRIGGSVRGGQAEFWPDAGRFAPDVPIVFEWWRVRPAPVALRVAMGGVSTELKVEQRKPGSGALAWRPSDPSLTGEATWVLLDANGEPLGGGSFVLLSAKEAETERARFQEAAAPVEAIPKGLAAAVVAAASGSYLW